MTESQSQPVGTLSPRLSRSDAVRQFIRRDKTPVAILVMAALVGTLAGLLGVAFDKAVEWVQQQRLASLAQVADSWLLVWPLAFILSAALAALGYYLRGALRLRRAARAFRRSKARWRSCGRYAGGA